MGRGNERQRGKRLQEHLELVFRELQASIERYLCRSYSDLCVRETSTLHNRTEVTDDATDGPQRNSLLRLHASTDKDMSATNAWLENYVSPT